MCSDFTGDGVAFSELGLDARLLQAVEKLGFVTATGIQAKAIPPLMDGRDVVARARTGSGKTAAFGLPLLERLKDGKPGPRALIMAPTRELALQVTDAIDAFSAHLRVRTVTVYGGSSYRPQLAALRAGVPIVVGTPGRLLDLLKRGDLRLDKIEMVVLDEADEMLRMGFIEDVEQILAETPKTKQVALFSATMPQPIRRVAERYLNDPLTVESGMDVGTAVDHIRQRVIVVPNYHKIEALVRYLRGEQPEATLVFCRTRAGCNEVADELIHLGLDAEALHGDMSQAHREKVLGRFRSRAIQIVVATDVAARGLDVEHITHVVNMDLPENSDIYTHRVGRTGRAGREGTALTLVTPNQRGRMHRMSKAAGASFEEYELPSDVEIVRAAQQRLEVEMANAGDSARAWVRGLKESGVRMEDVAAGALALLAKERNLPRLENVSNDLPPWAKKRTSLGAPGAPGAPKSRKSKDDKPAAKAPKKKRGEPKAARNEATEIEIFVGGGKKQGVTPALIVEAIMAAAPIAAREVGGIQIGDKTSFVRVNGSVAPLLFLSGTTLAVGGKDLKMAFAHPRPEANTSARKKRGSGTKKPRAKLKAKGKLRAKSKAKRKPKSKARAKKRS